MLATLLLAIAPLSQAGTADIAVTGYVEPITPSVFCPATHRLQCTDDPSTFDQGVLLRGVGIDLSTLEGKLLVLSCRASNLECNHLEVLGYGFPPPSTLDLCGTPAVGCNVRFRVSGSPAPTIFGLFLSTSPGFVPVDLTIGSILIDAPFTPLANGFVGGTGAAVDVTVPPDLALVGKSLWSQALVVGGSPLGLPRLSNVQCLTFLPPTVFCIQPDC